MKIVTLFLLSLFLNIEGYSGEKDLKSPCADGIKLGYVRKAKKTCTYCAFTDRVDRSKLYGQFDKVDQCTEARLLDEENYDTSKGCYWRYIKENKFIDLYEAVAMRNRSKLALQFKSKKDCERATKKGHNYIFELARERFFIHSIDSSKSPRFIKNCEKKEVLICEKFKEDKSLMILEKLQ